MLISHTELSSLTTKINLNFKNKVPAAQSTLSLRYSTNLLTLYSANHMKHVITPCGKNWELFNVKRSGTQICSNHWTVQYLPCSHCLRRGLNVSVENAQCKVAEKLPVAHYLPLPLPVVQPSAPAGPSPSYWPCHFPATNIFGYKYTTHLSPSHSSFTCLWRWNR